MRTCWLALAVALSAAGASAADEACQNDCNVAYWECSDACGPFGGALCEQQCSDAHRSCTQHCPTCPRTRDYRTTSLVAQDYYAPTGCFRNPFQRYRPFIHRFSRRTLRLRDWRETTQCDGQTATVLLRLVDVFDYCWQGFIAQGCTDIQPVPGGDLRICGPI
jgi:hypothetical protein